MGLPLECGNRKSSIVVEGTYVELNVVDRSSWGTALLHMTGSSSFNEEMRARTKERGMLLNEYGIQEGEHLHTFDIEEEVFDFLDVEFLEPVFRI